MDSELPSFCRGFLCWSDMGYTLSEVPEFSLRSGEYVQSENFWVSLAAVVECAKAGDHQWSRVARRWVDSPPFLFADRLAMQVLADTGNRQELDFIKEQVSGSSDDVAAYAAEALAAAGSLNAVPAMLTAWKRVRQNEARETIGYSICNLLESPKAHKLSDRVQQHPSPAWSPRFESKAPPAEEGESEFEAAVYESYQSQLDDFGPDANVMFGTPFNPLKVARTAIGYAEKNLPVPWLYIRHRFEAATGHACHSWFKGGRFVQIAALASLEQFLQNSRPNNSEKRQFWGHDIP